MVLNDICPFTTIASVFLTSVSSFLIFSSFPSLSTFLDLFMSAKWFVMPSMAMPDSGDSNLPNGLGNEVCYIIKCVAIYYEKGASGNAFLQKEKFQAQLSRKVRMLKALKETVRYV